jgi:hypothetical protein
VRELFRVCDDKDFPNETIPNLESENGVRLAFEVVDHTRTSVDMAQFSHEISGYKALQASKDPAGDFIGTTNLIRYSDSFPASVGVQHDIFGQKIDEAAHLTRTHRFEKSLEQIRTFPLRRFKARSQGLNVLSGAAQNLATFGFTLGDVSRYLRVVILKHFPHKKNGSLNRG